MFIRRGEREGEHVFHVLLRSCRQIGDETMFIFISFAFSHSPRRDDIATSVIVEHIEFLLRAIQGGGAAGGPSTSTSDGASAASPVPVLATEGGGSAVSGGAGVGGTSGPAATSVSGCGHGRPFCSVAR